MGTEPVSMVERMTRVLDAFTGGSPRLTLAEVTERTGLPRSTVHRILDQLVELRWVDHGDGDYGLGLRPLELGGLAVARNEVREAAAPYLEDLHLRTGMTVHLCVLDRSDVLCVDRLAGRGAAALPTRVGGRLPAHATASGKALLAWSPPGHLLALARRGLAGRTPRTLTAAGALTAELGRVRARGGLAYDREECTPGVACVAAALRDADRAVAAISVSGEAGRIDVNRLSPLVALTARRASSAVFPAQARTQRRRRDGDLPQPGRWPAGALEYLVEGIGGDYWL